jgi:Mn-dependent DtxR family transcriptional regulator
MSQLEVIELLEKIKKPLSRGEIVKLLNITDTLVSHAINKLVKYNEIKTIEINANQAMKRYHCKRRMRLYYC